MEGRTSLFGGLPQKIKTIPPENSSYDKKVFSSTENVTADVSETKLEELACLRTEVEKSCGSYFQCHLLLSAIKEVACESNSKFPLISQKVQQIIASEKVASVADLDFGKTDQFHEPLMILGLDDSHKCGSSTVLSYSEKINLKSFVEEKLLRKCSRIQDCMQIGGKDLSQKVRIHKDILSSDKFEFIRSAHSQFKEWFENSLAVRGLIKELVDMRLAISETVRTEAVPWFEAKCESLEFEAKILELQILVDMLSENPNMPAAMKKVDDYSHTLYEETKSELEKLKNDEKMYDELTDTEYYDVLKKYKRLKQELDNKTWILDQLS